MQLETGIASEIEISVVIASYNSAPLVFETLDSLEKQEEIDRSSYEIILADSSDDGSHKEVSKKYPDVKVVHSNQQKYPGAARNMGIAASNGRIIAFIDADAAASPKWLSRIKSYLALDNIAAVGGPILNGNPQKFLGWIPYWCEFTGFTLNSPETSRRVIPTCNLSIKRDAFNKHGPFLEEQFGNEDVLLTENLSKAGLSPLFKRDIPVFHTNRDNWRIIKAHLRKLGKCTGVARIKYDVAGAQTFRSWKSSLILPLIPLYKWALIFGRTLRDDPARIGRMIIATPWLIAGLIHWTLGMRDGLRDGK